MKNKQGQHTIEFAVLIAVVAAAILAGGAYINRSIQAKLKLTELQINEPPQVTMSIDAPTTPTRGGSREDRSGSGLQFPQGSNNFPNPFCAYTNFRIQLGNNNSFSVEVKDIRGVSLGVTTIANVNGTLQFSGTSRWSLGSVYNSQNQIFDIKWDASGISNGEYTFSFSNGIIQKGKRTC